MSAINPDTPVEILADAIREHRDAKWRGSIVKDSLDLHLYDVVVWYETWRDQGGEEDPNL